MRSSKLVFIGFIYSIAAIPFFFFLIPYFFYATNSSIIIYNIPIKMTTIVAFLASLSFFMITLVIWLIVNKKRGIDTVEFYPPENITALEAALLYKGKVTDNDVTSLFIDLIGKGYVKILRYSYADGGLQVQKLKEYDGTNEYEKIFFLGLFKNSDVVTKEELSGRIYETIGEIREKINYNKNNNLLFEKWSLKNRIIVWIMIAIIILLIYVQFINVQIVDNSYFGLMNALLANDNYWPDGFFGFQLPMMGFIAVMQTLSSASNAKKKKSYAKSFFIFSIIPWAFFIPKLLLSNISYLITYFFGIIVVIMLFKFKNNIIKRTKMGEELKNKIDSFKKLLASTDTKQIELLITKDPSYYYKILPYAYVFDLSDEWTKHFDDLSIEVLDWYNEQNAASQSQIRFTI